MKIPRRQFDGYVSSPRRQSINRVFFIGGARVVLNKEFQAKEEWLAERLLGPKNIECTERSTGHVIASTTGPGSEPEWDGSEGPPEDHKFFYGMDYV